MKLELSRIDVWSSDLADRPGSLARKLEELAAAGADLEFLLCRRTKAKAGMVYVAPVKGAKQIQAAKKAGFVKDVGMALLRVVGPDKVGMSALISETLADAGINIAGVSTTGVGKRFVSYLAFDCVEEASRAQRVLNKLG